MGSPSVFHTAPPQPASNARITCSPLFAGGAEASQNGFGLLMPAKSMLKSAISVRPSDCRAAFGGTSGSVPPARNEEARGVAAVGDRVDDLFAAVDAVAASEDLRVAGRAGRGIGDHAAAFVELYAAELLRHVAELRLPDRDR